MKIVGMFLAIALSLGVAQADCTTISCGACSCQSCDDPSMNTCGGDVQGICLGGTCTLDATKPVPPPKPKPKPKPKPTPQPGEFPWQYTVESVDEDPVNYCIVNDEALMCE